MAEAKELPQTEAITNNAVNQSKIIPAESNSWKMNTHTDSKNGTVLSNSKKYILLLPDNSQTHVLQMTLH